MNTDPKQNPQDDLDSVMGNPLFEVEKTLNVEALNPEFRDACCRTYDVGVQRGRDQAKAWIWSEIDRRLKAGDRLNVDELAKAFLRQLNRCGSLGNPSEEDAGDIQWFLEQQGARAIARFALQSWRNANPERPLVYLRKRRE